jgi:transcriptional regulator with PAS, ATPase and Fis domain
MVSANEFREDLFYRINLITIKLPPLRERSGDIPLLVNHFINNLKTIYRRESLTIDKKAMNWLKGLSWPGNIRELKNLIERTVLVTSKDIIYVEDFQQQFRYVPSKGSKESQPEVGVMTLDEMEETMIRKALEFHSNNLSKVAKSLGLSRSALYRRLEKYGLSE